MIVNLEDVNTEVLEKELEFRNTARYRLRLLEARDHAEATLKALQAINRSGRADMALPAQQQEFVLRALNTFLATEIPREVNL